MSQLHKLASGVLALQKEASDLREQVELHEKRAMAEEILLQARDKQGSPEGFKPGTIDDFLAKRAQLEAKSYEELQKISSFLEYFEKEDITISDFDDEPSRGNLNDWLNNIY